MKHLTLHEEFVPKIEENGPKKHMFADYPRDQARKDLAPVVKKVIKPEEFKEGMSLIGLNSYHTFRNAFPSLGEDQIALLAKKYTDFIKNEIKVFVK